jgi:hypothetical protein
VKRRRKRLLELEPGGDKRSHGSGIYSEGAGVGSEAVKQRAASCMYAVLSSAQMFSSEIETHIT